MKRNHFRLMLLVALAGCAESVEVVDSNGSRTYSSDDGNRLTAASKDAPEVVVRRFLRAQGLPSFAADALRVEKIRKAKTGRTHVRFGQVVGGARVYGAYVKAALDSDGRLVHLIDASARITRGAVTPARTDARAALATAVAAHQAASEDARVGAPGSWVSEPTVERVLVAGDDGALAEAFLVETWSKVDNLLRVALVGGDGRIVSVEDRTNTDSYNVFTVSPERTPQATLPGAASWLAAGAHTSLKIGGNNVHAYLDANADGAPDEGGAEISDGNFVAVFDATTQPGTGINRDVAVQNLFYLNNLIHDTLYAAGFDEAAGNFQEDNFDRGGVGGDSVNAEAQDGSGKNNANFSTPGDGRRPRMQMYLWSALGDHQLVVRAPAAVAAVYKAQGGQFSPALTAGIDGDVVLVDDGMAAAGGTVNDGCEAVTGLTGKIALVERGLCPFVQKVKNAQAAGAIAVVVFNNQGGDSLMVMGGSDPTITIPASLISQNDGAKLEAAAGVSATLRLTDPPLVARDGDLDADIVWHEYGHGLTWRMIGNMGGKMSGAIGEGMGDVLALWANEDDAMGEYSASDPRGIRTSRYGELVRTYGDFKGREVHYDGELYGAIGWRLIETFRKAGIPKTVLLGYLVDGMNYTKENPAYEDMRNGILEATKGTPHQCLIWRAFAAYGVGVEARGVIRGPRIWINDSKIVPTECQQP